MRPLEKKPKVLILETRNLLAIDATGLRALEDLAFQLAHQKSHFILSGIHKQPLLAITNAGLLDRIGEDNVCGSLAEAIEHARRLIGETSPPQNAH